MGAVIPRFHVSNFCRTLTVQGDAAFVQMLLRMTEVFVENEPGAEDDEVLHAFRNKLDLHAQYVIK